MRLRKLDIKDAPFMLEWMHDRDITNNLSTDFQVKTIDDCETFIKMSKNLDSDLHLAITNNQDEYMGTVSLKHIDKLNKTAEFAIVIRKCAMGNGYSDKSMNEILEYGLTDLELDAIYWCVANDNHRAIKFYDKNKYVRVSDVPDDITSRYSKSQLSTFYWYKVSK